MASGGARSRSGPAPDPNALRRDRKDDQAGWVTLSTQGRDGETPVFPGDGSDSELELWAELWVLPQAIEWERLRLHREVALYCRSYVLAMSCEAKAADRTLVRQLADSLGLNTAGLNRNRWKVGTPLASVPDMPADSRPVSARDRLRSVDGGAA